MAGLNRVRGGQRPPEDWLERDAAALGALLGRPTLLELGGDGPALFVSCLLHGNETTGWEAIRQLFAGRGDRTLPRPMAILVGNPEAAAQGRRRLTGQPDFNRVWPGADGRAADASAEAAIMAEVVSRLRDRGVIAAVDIHNNTGANPHYGCLTAITPMNLALASRFSEIALCFDYPTGVLSMAFDPHCPAITIECGQPGWGPGVRMATEFLADCLSRDFEQPPAAGEEPTLYRTAATIRFDDGARFGFGELPGGADGFVLSPDIERMNWTEVAAGTVLGRYVGGQSVGPMVLNAAGDDTGERWLRRDGDRLRTARALMPAMLTRDPEVIRNDCLCYLLERVSTGAPA